jgi:ribosomal protein S18 acetylase RimI-like enzyme
MVKYVKGNPDFLYGVMNLLKKIREQFKENGLNIYQNEEYPNMEIILNDLRNKDSTLIALDGDEVVGYIASEREEEFFKDCFDGFPKDYLNKYGLDIYQGRFIGFSRLMVDPNYQHQGIATKLFELLEKKFEGYIIIFLVDKANRKAQRLYAELGYKCLSLEKFPYGEYYVYIKNKLM